MAKNVPLRAGKAPKKATKLPLPPRRHVNTTKVKPAKPEATIANAGKSPAPGEGMTADFQPQTDTASKAPESPASAPSAPPATPTPEKPPTGLRAAAEAVLATWDEGERQDDTPLAATKRLAYAMEALRTVVAALPKPRARVPGDPKAGTKAEMVLEMIKAEGGKTLQEIMEATGWQIHSARAFLSVARKNGAPITIIPKNRETGIGPIYRSAS